MTIGTCECGCGETTRLAPYTNRRFGWIKGQPLRFINGHSRRKHWPSHTVDENGCWIWNGHINQRTGYGLFYKDHSNILAHRLYYEQHVGPIPPGLQIDHLCRVRACVNPDHLEPVTPAENTRRGYAARGEA